MSHRCVVDVADDTGALRIRVIGEVDMECASSLQQTIVSADVPPGGRVLLDMAEVAFIDSAGISAIIDAHKKRAADGIAITLVEVPPLVRTVLSLTGVDTYLDVDVPDPV
jgi:anti-anti-sigma factor